MGEHHFENRFWLESIHVDGRDMPPIQATIHQASPIIEKRTSFDIVIPLGPNDVTNIQKQIQNVRKYVAGFRKIYIISYDASITVEGCITISESIFPFKISDIAEYFAKHEGKNNRNGWYFQQLLKLYAGFVIPDILDQYLVIDSDVFFLKPTEFFHFVEPGVFQYCFGIGKDDGHEPYFEHMQRMCPFLHRVYEKSGVCHHMMYSRRYLRELFDLVCSCYVMFGEPESTLYKFWRIFLTSVTEHKKHEPYLIESGASEYEIYLNFMLQYHPEMVHLRTLNWENMPKYTDIDSMENGEHDFISVCHWWD